MLSRYQERLWEALPETARPLDLRPRLQFALERLRAVQVSERRVAGAQPGERVAPAPRVLDVGCGEGQLTAELARAGFEVVGVDVAEEPLRRARARHAGLDVRLIGEADWPLDDASFDAVWAGETIEHVLDTLSWLAEVRRVLRSGGSLLLSTPAHGPLTLLAAALSPRAFERRFDPRSDHVRFYNRGSLTRLLAEFGFEQIDVRGVGGRPGARSVLLAAAVRSRF
jgi:2-polyprenyl-3-methyl-5-hydroxy-6-metoxy-1,4-benzoquinol methylase